LNQPPITRLSQGAAAAPSAARAYPPALKLLIAAAILAVLADGLYYGSLHARAFEQGAKEPSPEAAYLLHGRGREVVYVDARTWRTLNVLEYGLLAGVPLCFVLGFGGPVLWRIGGWLALTLPLVARRRCPRCREGDVYATWQAIHTRCPVCKLEYQPHAGYFTGAMYFNYFLMIGSFLPTALVLFLAFDASIPAYIGAALLQTLLLAPVLVPFSRVMWLHFHFLLSPR